jgi:hypothetical protein
VARNNDSQNAAAKPAIAGCLLIGHFLSISGGSGIGTPQLDLRVAAFIFEPQLPHHPLHTLADG